MKPRAVDVRRLDVRAFAKAAGSSRGAWQLDSFQRLRELLMLPEPAAEVPAVTWALTGEERPVQGGAAEIWLHLHADTSLPLVCQRCLQRCDQVLSLERHFQFVADEAAAAGLDGEVEHDVLVLSRELDLHELLEDELLLGLPLVPRHDACPQPLLAAPDTAAEDEHPFAALAALRRSGS